jgi:putative drug exporter of the RND superfamily
VVAAREEIAGYPGVARVDDPYLTPAGPADPRVAGLVATDRRGVLVTVTLRRDLGAARQGDLVDRVSGRLLAVGTAVPGSTARTGSVTQLVDEITRQVQADLQTGEGFALPASLLVMVVVFGGFLAAGLPIVGAVGAIAGALGTLLGFSYLIDLDASVVNVVTVLGLGLCIDYGLLMVSRFREELRRHPVDGQDREAVVAAVARTTATAGRTVLFSGVTVAISLAGLMVFQADILRAIGAAGVSVVLVALLVALTLVPALLAVGGPRLARPGRVQRLPLVRRLGDVAPEHGAFSRLARAVQRRPVLVLLGTLLLLGLAAVPALGLRMVSSGVALLPRDAAGRQFFESLDARYPQAALPPVTVVARTSAELAAGYARQLATLPGVAQVLPPTEQGTGADRITVLRLRTAAPDQSEPVRDLVRRIRADRPDFPVLVGGQTAALLDYSAAFQARAPLAGLCVVLATFALLFAMTGSVLIPVKALLMNVVSLGAAFGLLVWVFQDGHLEGLLGFDSAGGIETTIPPLVLAFAFGLSMDYEVFLLARIKEQRDAGMGNGEAVVRGLQGSGRIITSAALIIAVVFAGFVAGQLLVIKQTGVALATAVAVDATLVRMLLVPATMTLLGEWNWWAPGPLRRLHRRFGLAEPS